MYTQILVLFTSYKMPMFLESQMLTQVTQYNFYIIMRLIDWYSPTTTS